MSAFTDRLGRTIEIDVDEFDAIARHEGRKVGEVTTTGLRETDKTGDMPAQITGMFVDKAYQRAGIGLELLNRLSDELGALIPAEKNVGRGNQNALTDEGLYLTRRAQEQGYVLDFEDEQPPADDHLEGDG